MVPPVGELGLTGSVQELNSLACAEVEVLDSLALKLHDGASTAFTSTFAAQSACTVTDYESCRRITCWY